MISNRIKKIISTGRSGFTLIETLFAILILTLALTGPLTIASTGLGAALIAKDQTTAFYLAQDAIEYVRFVRDSSCLASSPCSGSWLLTTGPLGSCISTTGSALCMVDSIQNTVTSCVGGNCSPLNYDSSNHWYTYAVTGGSVTTSIFTRTVSIETPVSTNSGEAAMTVTVRWTDTGGISRSVTERENLFNWQ